MAYKPPHARQHRVYQPGKRHMELMPSLSRSSGLDRDGDALRDHKVQEEYRAFIQGKVDEFWRRFPYSIGPPPSKDQKRRQEEQENILILFRKLREGLLATNRKDAFALEAYETSLYLAILFHSDKQTTSILPRLLPHLYLTRPEAHTPSYAHRALSTTLLSLLYYLLQGYPSQNLYQEYSHSLPATFLPRDSAAYHWLTQLTRCLCTRNYARLQELTDRSAVAQFLPASESVEGRRRENTGAAGPPINLALEAMCVLVEDVRAKAQATAWLVIRSAYKELHCVPPPADAPAAHHSTSEWLAKSLALHSIECNVTEPIKAVNAWLEQKCTEGEVRRKEGSEGRWIVCKVPLKT